MATELERAVILAARSAANQLRPGLWDGPLKALIDAIDALDAAGETSIPWAHLAEGDHLKSLKTGKFYEVLASVKVGDLWRITLRTGAKESKIQRPTDAEPMAVVRRGPTGRALDVVLYSGERSR